MITLDLSSIAFHPYLEEQTVKYVAAAMSLGTAIPAHRFIVKSFENETYVDAADTFYVNHSAYKAATSSEVLAAADTDKFFYGNAMVGFHINAMAGAWNIRVTMRGPGIYPILFFASNVVNTLALNEVVNIKMPMMPIYDVSIKINAVGAADVCSVFSHSVWNGLFFSR